MTEATPAPEAVDPDVLILLGGLFLLGLLTDVLGRRTFLPRAALLLLLGFLLGPAGTGWLGDVAERWFPFVSNVALVMLGFLLGGEFTRANLRARGRSILIVSLCKVTGAFACVSAGALAFGVRWELAILLGAVATATAPAATVDVVRSDRAEGPFTRTLLGIVAIDDTWGLIAFSVALAIVEAEIGASGSSALAVALRDLGGAALLGVALGAPAAVVTGRIAPGEPTLAEALALVFLCAGLALWLEVSFLLAAMVMGATVSNLARHHRRPFRAIEGIEWPFLILFFALAGASLHLEALRGAFAVVLLYVALRLVGIAAGAFLGVRAARDRRLGRRAARWMGMALMPQAGVALGMALVASQRLPSLGEVLLPVIVGSTALLEIGGPVLTRIALRGVGESHAANGPEVARAGTTADEEEDEED